MKRLLNIGLAAGVRSLFPILMWVILEYTTGDVNIAKGFSTTYSFQFVWCIVNFLIIEGTFTYELKSGKKRIDAMKSSVLVAFVIALLIGSTLMLLNEVMLINVLKVGMQYKMSFILGITCLVLDVIPCGAALMQNYLDNDRKASMISFAYYGFRLLASYAFGKMFSINIACVLLIFSLFIANIIVFVKYLIPHKLFINTFKGVKYKKRELVGNLAMALIYTFGLGRNVSYSKEAFIAYNALGVASDTQWDMAGQGVDTYTTLKVSNGEYEKDKKSIMINSMIYGAMLFISCIIMLVAYRSISDFNLKLAIEFVLIEALPLPLCCVYYAQRTWIAIEHSNSCINILEVLLTKVLRIIVVFFLASKYSMPLGCLIEVSTNIIVWNIAYYVLRRKDKKKLLAEGV